MPIQCGVLTSAQCFISLLNIFQSRFDERVLGKPHTKLFRAVTLPFGKSFAPNSFQNSPKTTFPLRDKNAPDTFAGLLIKTTLSCEI